MDSIRLAVSGTSTHADPYTSVTCSDAEISTKCESKMSGSDSRYSARSVSLNWQGPAWKLS